MPKWKLYIAEVAPYAIGAGFLFIVALNPNTSTPKHGDSFSRIVDEYLKRDYVFKRNLPTLIEKLSHITLKASTDDISPPPVLRSRNTHRAQIKTTVDLEINGFDKNYKDNGDLRTQLAAMREHGFSALIGFAMIKE